jgi:glutaredoxin-like YruB-family protein
MIPVMKKVIIYSTPTCIYCKMAKGWLEENKIPFEDYDVYIDAEKRKEMLDKTGQMGVPVITVDEEIIVGFDKKRLMELLEIKD